MRISFQLVLVLVLLNSAAGVLVASGVAGDMGIQPNPGGDEKVAQANQSASSVDAGGGFGDTLFGLFISIAKAFEGVSNVVFFGPAMLTNLGIPSWATGMFSAVTTLIVGADAAYLLTGRSP
jgi:hypothetical protein